MKKGEKRHIWTQEEIEFLKINYVKYGIKYCMENLNLSRTKIKGKLSQLKIRRTTTEPYNWSESEIEFLKDNYVSLGTTECCRILKIKRDVVRHKAKMLKLTYKQPKWSSDEIKFLIENYPIKGPTYCGEKLNRSMQGIYFKAMTLNLHPDKKVDVTLFSDPNKMTPESVYILGLIYADGSIRNGIKSKYCINVTLIKKDMEKLLLVFNTTGDWSVKEYKKLNPNHSDIISVTTFNKDLFNFLVEYGYYNKSSTDTPDKLLDLIPSNLKYQWMRGYFEGDGCIMVNQKNNAINMSLNIASHYNQNWGFMENMFDELNIKCRIQRNLAPKDSSRGSNSYVILTKILSVIIFCDYIYEGYETDKIGIHRKWERYQKIKTFYNKKYLNKFPDVTI
jgi:hypothetical protein